MHDEEAALTPEQEARLVLRTALPNLAEPVRTLMLAEPNVLAALDLPVGDFVRLWNHRFHRPELLNCLRNLANDRPAPLASADCGLEVEEASLTDEGAGVLRFGTEVITFANAALLSDDLARRSAAFDVIVADGEMSLVREMSWRTALQIGSLDDELFIALEIELETSPEAAFRTMVREIQEGSAKFDDLVPFDLDHYAGLLGLFPTPPTLDAFQAAWLAEMKTLDPVRLLRRLKLCGPLSILSGALVAEASDTLSIDDRLALAQFFEGALDPLSVTTAFEIACRHRANPAMQAIADTLAPRLFDRADPLIETFGPALVSAVTLTTALTARQRTLAGLPLYARRLTRLLHACHILEVFREASVDLSAFEGEVMRSLAPQGRLADLCDAREAPIFQSHHLTPALLHAKATVRVGAAIARIDEADWSVGWKDAADRATADDLEAGWGLFYFAPTLLDELSGTWGGLIELSAERADEAKNLFESGADEGACISELIKLSVAFEVPAEHRVGIAAVLPAFLGRSESANFLLVAEIALQLAARWRDIGFSDRVVEILLRRAGEQGLPDPGSAPRLLMIAAAAAEDRGMWLQRAGDIARNFAYVQKKGLPSTNMMRALGLLRDFEPDLAPHLAAAKAFTILAYDTVPRPSAEVPSASKEGEPG